MVTNNSCNYVPSNHNIQIGGTNGSLTNGGTGTIGQPLWSGGAAADPAFTTVPAFMWFQNTTTVGVTGGGTAYQLKTSASWTKAFDQGGGGDLITFPATILTFTAPVTGIYDLRVKVLLGAVAGTNNDGFVRIVPSTTNRLFVDAHSNPGNTKAAAGVNTVNMWSSGLILMTAADTATFDVTVNNGPAAVTVNGSASQQDTMVMGFIIQRTA